MERYKAINTYLNAAVVESNLQKAKDEDKPLSVVLFKYNVDLDNAFFFKSLMSEIYALFSYASIFYNDKDSFLVVLQNKKLHESITIFKKIQHRLLSEYDLRIDRVGITEMSKDDTLETLLKRVGRYLVISKRLPIGKIIYGTSSFDFYNDKKREDTLKSIIENSADVMLYNLYKGIPIKEEASIVEFDGSRMCLQTSYEELLYLKQNEEFLYIQHKDFPYIIKGYIYKYDFNNETVCIKNLEFQDISVVDRSSIRITPPKNIRVMIEYQNSIVCDGMIKSISTDSLVVKVDKSRLKKILMLKNSEFILKFRLFAKNSIAIDNISLRATVFSVSGDDMVFLIKPNSFIKMKISNYVKSIQDEIIKNLKKQITVQ